MFYPLSVLTVMFAYQPPNEDTTPKYVAVGEARKAFEACLTSTLSELELQEKDGLTPDFPVLHRTISEAALVYAQVINEYAPGFAEDTGWATDDALKCVIYARMWANKALRAPAGAARGRLIALAKTESEKAELAANSGIALNTPVTEAFAALA